MEILRELLNLMHAFFLIMFDHAKCTTLEVKFYIKQFFLFDTIAKSHIYHKFGMYKYHICDAYAT